MAPWLAPPLPASDDNEAALSAASSELQRGRSTGHPTVLGQ